ncbi:MAG: GxxExxY protein [Crocinitomicaceae bacterium]|nr:GxxExxY protein [Crocinitomicaceae bacterium]
MKLLIELKSVESIKDIHIAQNLTYLKSANYKPGLILNFNETTLKSGIRRVINNYIDY